MTFKINHYDKHNPQLEIFLTNGRRISFSVQSVRPEDHDWLGGVLVRQIQEEINYAVAVAIRTRETELQRLLGITK